AGSQGGAVAGDLRDRGDGDLRAPRLLYPLALDLARHGGKDKGLCLLSPEPRVLQHGVPRPELLDAAHAQGLRLGDDRGYGAGRDPRALRRRPLRPRAGARWGSFSEARPAQAKAGSDLHRSALAPRPARQLRRVALAEDTDLRWHQALDD